MGESVLSLGLFNLEPVGDVLKFLESPLDHCTMVKLNKYVRSITNKQSKVFAEHVTSPDIYIDSINATDLFITFDGVDLSNARNLALYLENYGNQIRLSDSLRVVFDGQLIKTSIVQVKDVVTTIVKINRCIKTLKFVFTRRTSQSDDLVLNNFSLQGCDNEETYINSLESIKQMESDYVEKIDGLAIEALLEQIENKYLFAHLFERFRSLNHFKVVVHSLKIFSNVNSDLLAQFLSILSERPNPRLELLFLHGEFGDRSKEMGTMQKLFELCFDKKIVLNFDADEHTMTEIGDYSFATIPDITKLSLQLALEAENLQENGRPIVNVPKFEWKSLDKLRTLNINFPCQFEAQEMAKIMEQFQNTESLNKLYLKFNQSCVEISPPTIASVFDHLPRHISHLKLENAITSFADQIDRLPTLLPHILSMVFNFNIISELNFYFPTQYFLQFSNLVILRHSCQYGLLEYPKSLGVLAVDCPNHAFYNSSSCKCGEIFRSGDGQLMPHKIINKANTFTTFIYFQNYSDLKSFLILDNTFNAPQNYYA